MAKSIFNVGTPHSEQSERWLPVPGFEGSYEVSDRGHVRSVDRIVTNRNGRRVPWKGKLLKQNRKNGYPIVALSKNSDVQVWYVHRLVLVTFVGEPDEGNEVCHNNGIRTDNRLENLRWDTHLANVGDTINHGRHRSIGDYNGQKTHCHRGHPFDETNTQIRPEGRACRECRRIMERARYHRAKQIA